MGAEDVGPGSLPEPPPDTERVEKVEVDTGGGPEPEASTTILEGKGDSPDVKVTAEEDSESS